MPENFDNEKIDSYFESNKKNSRDESYIESIFTDEAASEELKQLLARQFDELTLDNENLDHVLYRIHYDINMKKPEHKDRTFDHIIKWALRVAAAVIIPLALYLAVHTYKEASLKKESWVEIKAPAWTKAKFNLPDGTVVWLNSNSSLKYCGNYLTDRQVSLIGEAFFDVHKNKKSPFVLTTDEIKIEVLGTRFNIASYDNEDNVEILLEEGKLKFGDGEKTKSYIMKPNELIVYNKAQRVFSANTVQAQKYTSWIDGKLVFRNDPLDVIARRLARWYNIDVEIDGASTENIRWRATFIDENLEDVLSFLKRSLPVDYKIENKDIQTDDASKKKVIITLRTK